MKKFFFVLLATVFVLVSCTNPAENEGMTPEINIKFGKRVTPSAPSSEIVDATSGTTDDVFIFAMAVKDTDLDIKSYTMYENWDGSEATVTKLLGTQTSSPMIYVLVGPVKLLAGNRTYSIYATDEKGNKSNTVNLSLTVTAS